MTWDQAQQVIRILLYSGGAALFGSGIQDDAMFQQAVGALLSLGGVAWWFFWERNQAKVRKK